MRGLMVGAVVVLACGVATAGEEKPDAVQLEDLEWLIGDWEGSYVMPDGFPELGPAGAKVDVTASWRWTLGKRFMSLKLRDEIDGKLTSTGDEILGVDNATGKLGHWFYGSNGFHGGGHWFRDGDSWAIKWRRLEPSGKVYDGVGDHIQIDADTYEWQIRDLKENGKAIDDWPKVTFRRKLGTAADEDDLWQAYRNACRPSDILFGT